MVQSSGAQSSAVVIAIVCAVVVALVIAVIGFSKKRSSKEEKK